LVSELLRVGYVDTKKEGHVQVASGGSSRKLDCQLIVGGARRVSRGPIEQMRLVNALCRFVEVAEETATAALHG
jgi:hypothetical protein